MQAPPERLAYVAALNPTGGTLNDAMLVIDVEPASANYGKRVGQTVLPNAGDELHHFGWNACSSALCPYAPHPHVERRYLVVPGIRSSRIYILDIKPDSLACRSRGRCSHPGAPAGRGSCCDGRL